MCLPDLTVSDFVVGSGLSPDGATFHLCVQEPDEYVTVKNLGPSDSGPYRIALMLFDYAATQVVDGCGIPVPDGTKAGETTTLTSQGCCQLDAKLVIKGRQYLVLVMVDGGQQVTESNEDNNSAVSAPFGAGSVP
jgi:hypothetical protein